MVSFSYLIKNCFNVYNVYIPLIQRNYKWEEKNAGKLVSDLWNAYKNEQSTYTMGMITFYCEETRNQPRFQIIDGQQRIITLFMILKYLGEEVFFFEFERDEGIILGNNKRISYLQDITNYLQWEEKNLYTDVYRFKKNYIAIENSFEENKYEESEREKFVQYIQNKLYFLLHISETEPFDEFMNLNHNKTRFVISDRIRANLIIDSDSDVKRKEVLELFEKLSKCLFFEKHIWELVSQGYCEENILVDNTKRKKNKLYPDENRLKLLCCERYGSDEFDINGTLGYDFEKEFTILNQYNNILNTLLKDIENNNWNSYNGFNCIYKLHSRERFFVLIKNIEKNSNIQSLEEKLIEKIDDLSNFAKACFIESQLGTKKLELNFIDQTKNNDKNKENDETIESAFNEKMNCEWYNNGNEGYEVFKQIYYNYIKEKTQVTGDL